VEEIGKMSTWHRCGLSFDNLIIHLYLSRHELYSYDSYGEFRLKGQLIMIEVHEGAH
jgi:hypothetical protein